MTKTAIFLACALANASENINGIKFQDVAGVGKVSVEPLSDDDLALFDGIPGYYVCDASGAKLVDGTNSSDAPPPVPKSAITKSAPKPPAKAKAAKANTDAGADDSAVGNGAETDTNAGADDSASAENSGAETSDPKTE